MKSLHGKTVFITGASSGIGAALAREFSKRGADVALLARRKDRLQEVAREVEANGRKALVIECDVTQESELGQAAQQTRQVFGRIDVVVANAGFGVVAPIERLSLDDYRRQFETNVFGVIRTIFVTLDDLKKSHGTLMIVGSVTGYIATPAASPYAMSKHSVRALAESLSYELAPQGVAVKFIAPGFVESEIRRVNNKGELRESVKDSIPSWLRMPVDKAARQIVDALSARRREVVITGHGKIAVFLQRHVPWLVSAIISAFRLSYRDEITK